MMILGQNELKNKQLGFTLIELLIVVAIIAILAAIAVPNFLQAQTRAKITRVRSDMRSAATAIESYAVDYNTYPRTYEQYNKGTRGGFNNIQGLSTPTAYMTSCEVIDPFNIQRGVNPAGSGRFNVTYINIQYYQRNRSEKKDVPHWGTFCYGPDRLKGPNAIDGSDWKTLSYGRFPPAPVQNDHYFTLWNYDATNGLKSNGDIFRWG